MARSSLNKVILIGDLVNDPHINLLATGTKLCSFTIATDRYFLDSKKEKRKETEFIRIAAWQKMADVCERFLKTGYKVYIEGRLHTRTEKDKQSTEVVVEEIKIINAKGELPEWEE